MKKTPARIIEEKGGATAVAQKVGRKPSAVRMWKYRNEFPRRAWPEITAAFPDLTVDVLLQLERAA